LLPAVALADEPVVKLGGLVDARYARTDAERSWLDGGFGKLRYGASVDGRSDLFRLAQLSLLLDAELGPLLTVHVQANLDAEPDQAGLRGRADLIEAFALYRPELSPSLRLRIRGGAFFPPVSLEHEGPAWTSPYTITSSAANSWIGEEVRTIGAEGALVLKHDAHEMRLLGAGFGGNDPAGSLLAWRGWALHDRQSGLGDRLVYPPLPSLLPGGPFAENARWAGPFVEIDGTRGLVRRRVAPRRGPFRRARPALRQSRKADGLRRQAIRLAHALRRLRAADRAAAADPLAEPAPARRRR
jgi:hypothetical protein